MNDYRIVVDKSTVPVGSTARFQQLFDDRGIEVTVLSNPEFLREGTAVGDFFHPDRIVIGSEADHAAELLVELYRDLQAPIIITNPASSEMIKYASNAFLATKIGFINSIANLCEEVDADLHQRWTKDQRLVGMFSAGINRHAEAAADRAVGN